MELGELGKFFWQFDPIAKPRHSGESRNPEGGAIGSRSPKRSLRDPDHQFCKGHLETSGIKKKSPWRSLPRVSGRTVNPIRSLSAWFSRLWE